VPDASPLQSGSPGATLTRRWMVALVAYVPDWMSLADVLRRVMATGIEASRAKLDLCGAIADRKISTRVRIAVDDEFGWGGRLFSHRNVEAPAHLDPSDLDWVLSRPLKQSWEVGPRPGEHYAWIGGWKKRPLDLIELASADVTAVLCGQDAFADPGASPPTRTRAQRDRAERHLQELFPEGVPDQSTLPNAHLCRQVADRLKALKEPDVGNDSILRAAGRRK
jgi:hypothetical protein